MQRKSLMTFLSIERVLEAMGYDSSDIHAMMRSMPEHTKLGNKALFVVTLSVEDGQMEMEVVGTRLPENSGTFPKVMDT